MTFNYAIPRAVYIDDPVGFRAPDGRLIPRLKRVRRCLKKGVLNRRHILVRVEDGYEYTYHATRGWKKRKA